MIKLVLGDCAEILDRMVKGEEYVDHIIADIPYNINYADWDTEFDLDKILPLLNSLIKPGGNIIIFNGWSNVLKTKSALDKYFEIRNWIIYDRIKGRGSTRNLVSTREDILWYSKGKNEDYVFNKLTSTIPKKTGGMGKKNGLDYRVLSNVWSDISPIVPWSSERVDHPTQKSLQLMKRCVEVWTNPGDLVLDFTMGSGSTGVACKMLNRQFIGIEKEEPYFEIVKKRLEEAENSSFFEPLE